jgi:hypothetical protein
VFYDSNCGKTYTVDGTNESTVMGTRRRGLIRVGHLYVKMRMVNFRGGMSLRF